MRLIVGTASRYVLALSLLSLGATPLWGQTIFTWLPTSGGLFNTAANWAPAGGPPNAAGETAFFDLPNTQTVTFQTNTTVGVHSFSNGNVTYQLNQTTASMSGGAGLVVGGTVGQTGRLTIVNGTMAGDMTIGNAVASTGFFTIGADALFDAAAISTTVGSSGIGTLTITSGGDYTGTASLFVGNAAGSNGTVAVTGDGSSLTSGSLNVGSSGVGEMTVSGGASASTQVLTIGDTSSAVGELLVTGAGSTLSTNNQFFTVGATGDGVLAIAAGGAVSSGIARIALNAGSTGSAVVSGAGSTWTAATLTVGGNLGANGGAGTLTIADGGAVNVTGNTEIRATAGTSLTIDGGTLTANGSFTKLGTLNHRDGTLHVKGIFDNGASAAALVIDGSDADDLPTLRLSNVAGVNDVTSMTVGNVNRGALVVDAGRVYLMASNNLSIGAGASSSGSVTATGAGTLIGTDGTVSVGGLGATSGGAGTLSIRDGATVQANTFNLFSQGSVELDGGTLRMIAFNANGGTFNFVRGTFSLNAGINSLLADDMDAILGQGHVLNTGQNLTSVSAFTIATPITVDGGTLIGVALTNNSVVTVAGTGVLQMNSSITNNATLLLDHNTVPTSGGTLTNNASGVIRGAGFIGNAVLNSGLVNATDGDITFTAAVTNSASTGLISGRDGALTFGGGLSNSGSVAFSGGAMDVYGDVTQNVGGRITVTGGGVTTFYDDVTIAAGANNIQASAVGSVQSAVVFLGSYNGGVSGGGAAFIEGDHRPGSSAGLVGFGGDLFYGGGATLNIELGGLTRGTQYDAVDVADDAMLGGNVNVSLINGFTPALGNTFEILTAIGGRSGTFQLGTLPALAGGLGWALSYTSTSALLSVVTPGFQAADFDEDGDVDGNDLTRWRNNFGTGTTHMQGDADGDLDADGHDFLTWQRQLGSPATAAATASIPEPATPALLASGALAMILRRGRSRKLMRP